MRLQYPSGFLNVDYEWKPGVNLCWDIRKPLPFPDKRFIGIFSAHCLEHFPLGTVCGILREAKRLLAPGGIIRIVVPDAELYLRTYVSHLNGNTDPAFPFQISESTEELYTALRSVNRVYYQDRESLFGHRCMFDFELLAKVLDSVGFDEIRRCRFGVGKDQGLLIDERSRAIESLYVEASV